MWSAVTRHRFVPRLVLWDTCVLFSFLTLFLLNGCGLVQKGSWVPPPTLLNEVSVRQIPAYNAIESEVTGTIEKSWGKGFRQDARYLSTVNSPLQYPVLINLPAWEDHPPEPSGTIYVQLILQDNPNYETPREKGLGVVSIPPRMVAYYAWEGTYTYEHITFALKKIYAELRRRGIPSSGSPRVLIYRNPDWTLGRWCLGEVEVPVPDKSMAD